MIVRAGRSSSVTCGKTAVPHLGWSVVGSGVLRVVEAGPWPARSPSGCAAPSNPPTETTQEPRILCLVIGLNEGAHQAQRTILVQMNACE